MLLTWRGTLLSAFLPTKIFLVRGFLQILLTWLMMKVAIFLGVHSGWQSLVSGWECCSFDTDKGFVFSCWWVECCCSHASRYGDMPAHNLLWRECEKSSDNVAARLAAIPLVQVVLCYEHIVPFLSTCHFCWLCFYFSMLACFTTVFLLLNSWDLLL